MTVHHRLVARRIYHANFFKPSPSIVLFMGSDGGLTAIKDSQPVSKDPLGQNNSMFVVIEIDGYLS